MVCNTQRMLVVTARGDQLACLFFKGKELIDFEVSRKSATSIKLSLAKVNAWLQTYQPDVTLSENPDTAKRKGERNCAIIEAIGTCFETHDVFHIWVDRKQNYKNAYQEATALSECYPGLLPWRPKKPKIWQSEHRHLVYFEALSMALQVLEPDCK